MNEKIKQLVLKTASKSHCSKRKVGAVITNSDDVPIATGFNFNSHGSECEDENGITLDTVTHAEQAAIHNIRPDQESEAKKIYVSHPPCQKCKDAINETNIEQIIIMDSFMKFDKDKLNYDLIPPTSIEYLASILTYGAKKYKANNWRNAVDLGRYRSAMMRHYEAYRKGEFIDKESGQPHLAHVLTNVVFLLELELEKQENKDE